MEMTEDEFDRRYKPIDADNGSWIWQREEVVRKKIPDNRVWTAVDTDEGDYVSAGWHAVNAWGHVVTEVPWVEGDEGVVLDKPDDEDEEEDGAPCCPDPECGGNPCTFPGYDPMN